MDQTVTNLKGILGIIQPIYFLQQHLLILFTEAFNRSIEILLIELTRNVTTKNFVRKSVTRKRVCLNNLLKNTLSHHSLLPVFLRIQSV